MVTIERTVMAVLGNGEKLHLRPHVVDLMYFLINKKQKIQAIKFVRGEFTIGLRDAKEIVDTLEATPLSGYTVNPCE